MNLDIAIVAVSGIVTGGALVLSLRKRIAASRKSSAGKKDERVEDADTAHIRQTLTPGGVARVNTGAQSIEVSSSAKELVSR